MHRFQSILVGLQLDAEGSRITTGSRKAALQAECLAEKTGATVSFLHSTCDDRFVDHDASGHTLVRQGPTTEGFEALESFAAEYRASGVLGELVYTRERPWLAMVRRVLAGESDLVVVGRHDRSDAAAAHLGSVARKLMRKCPAPVWVVDPGHDLVHRLVLGATDLSPVGDEVLRLAAYVAESQDCALHALHAYQISMELQLEAVRMSAREYSRRIHELENGVRRSIRGSLAPVTHLEPHLHIGCDAPSRAILGAVERLDPDLLVMGTLSRGGVAGLLVGNTAERLLGRLECSLLTVKPDDFVCPITLGDSAEEGAPELPGSAGGARVEDGLDQILGHVPGYGLF